MSIELMIHILYLGGRLTKLDDRVPEAESEWAVRQLGDKG